MKRRFVLCQISNKVINPDAGQRKSEADNYYEDLYENRRNDGYYRPEHFWELPLWIGEMTYTLSDHHEVVLHVISDLTAELPTWSDNVPTFYCFSVLDVNRVLISDVVWRQEHFATRSNKYVFGGYVGDPEACISDLPAPCNCRWFNSISDLCDMFDTPYTYGTDWSLFYGTECIPRLTMSYGCKHRCRFCTVPNEVQAVSLHNVMVQALSFNGLKFKLVYLNDKTFGQSDNAEQLARVYNVIKTYNSEFQGFIVQTSVATVLRKPVDYWTNLHIKVVELGVETLNTGLLKRYNKPQTSDMIHQAVNKLSDGGVRIIANIMLGLIGETSDTYGETLHFLLSYKAKLYALNIYTLALYADAEISDEVESVEISDSDELATDRTFWTDNERRNYGAYAPVFYTIASHIVKQ